MTQHFESEEDFENSASPASNKGVAIDNKHAYKTVVVHSNQKDPSYSKVIPSKSTKNYIKEASGDVEASIKSAREASPSRVISEVAPLKNIDKINNLAQKEISLSRVGVTREKAYRVIAQALDAHRWMDVVDRQGNVKQEWVADLDKQRWGAEMAIKMFGDMIERKEVEYDLGDKTLDKLRGLSVAELKSRAADILLGKKSVITDAEVVR